MTGQFDKLVPSIVAVACLCFARSSIGAEGARWSYTGATGPAKWASLDKAFGLCKSGTDAIADRHSGCRREKGRPLAAAVQLQVVAGK